MARKTISNKRKSKRRGSKTRKQRGGADDGTYIADRRSKCCVPDCIRHKGDSGKEQCNEDCNNIDQYTDCATGCGTDNDCKKACEEKKPVGSSYSKREQEKKSAEKDNKVKIDADYKSCVKTCDTNKNDSLKGLKQGGGKKRKSSKSVRKSKKSKKQTGGLICLVLKRKGMLESKGKNSKKRSTIKASKKTSKKTSRKRSNKKK